MPKLPKIAVVATLCLAFTGCGRIKRPMPILPFGGQGTARQSFGNYNGGEGDKTQKVLPQEDGRVMLVGTSFYNDTTDCYEDKFAGTVCRPHSDTALLRFGLNAEPDISFAETGARFIDNGFRDFTLDAAMDADGRLLVLQRTQGRGLSSPRTVLFRLGPDGVLEKSFGQGGIVEVNTELMMDRFFLRLADSKIYVAWNSERGGVAIRRYSIDGALDTSYGAAGLVTTAEKWNAWDLHIDSAGSAVLASTTKDFSGSVVAKFDSSGALDKSFAGVGWVNIGSIVSPLFDVQTMDRANGKITIGLAQTSYTEPSFSSFVRLNEDGSFDNSFGTSGCLNVPSSYRMLVQGIKVRSDDKIVAVARRFQSPDLYFARLNPDGSYDSKFARGGNWDFAMTGWSFPSIALDAAERIVMGTSDNGYYVARFNADGKLDAGNATATIPRARKSFPRAFLSRWRSPFAYPR